MVVERGLIWWGAHVPMMARGEGRPRTGCPAVSGVPLVGYSRAPGGGLPVETPFLVGPPFLDAYAARLYLRLLAVAGTYEMGRFGLVWTGHVDHKCGYSEEESPPPPHRAAGVHTKYVEPYGDWVEEDRAHFYDR